MPGKPPAGETPCLLVFSCTSPAGCCQKQQKLYWLAPFKYVIKHFYGLTRWAPHHFQKVIFSVSGSTFPDLGSLLFPTHSAPPPYLRVVDISFSLSEKYFIAINSSLACLGRFLLQLLPAPSNGVDFHLPSRSPLLFCLCLLLHRPLWS